MALAYLTAIDARDWARLGGLLAEDAEYRIPQTRERVRGREAIVRFNREYPGDWRLVLRDAHGDDEGAALHFGFQVDGDELDAAAFLRFDATGRIAEVIDYWPEPYDPPPGREHLVERY